MTKHRDEIEPPAPTPAPDAPTAVPLGGGSEPDDEYVDDPTAHLRNLPTDQGTPPTPGQGLPPVGE